jgi:uncharacterized protein
VIDTRELGRRPGSMRKVRRTAAAPDLLGTEMIKVPVGAELDLDLRLESVMEGVLVTGTVTAPLTGECGRCLEPVTSEIEVELQELYAYAESDVTEDEGSRLVGDLLDLEPVLRDAVVLALSADAAVRGRLSWPVRPLRARARRRDLRPPVRRFDIRCVHGTADLIDPAGWRRPRRRATGGIRWRTSGDCRGATRRFRGGRSGSEAAAIASCKRVKQASLPHVACPTCAPTTTARVVNV